MPATPFVPFPNTVLVEVRYTYQGEKCENTLYFSNGDGVTETNMVELANLIGARLITSHMPNLPTTLVLREIHVTDLSSQTAPAVDATITLPVAGGRSAEASPNNCSLCVSFRSAARGRSSRGRNYLLGLCEDQVASNVVSSAFTGIWTSFYTYLLTQTELPDFIWSVASRRHNKAWRTEGQIIPVQSFLFVDLTVDSQRRRLPGRGR